MSREFYVPCTSYAYPIRLKLPDIGNRLKRFITLSNSEEDDVKEPISRTDVTTRINEITDDLLTDAILETYSEVSINDPDLLEDAVSMHQSDSFVTASSRHDVLEEQWNDNIDQEFEIPSTSVRIEEQPHPTSEDQDRGRMVTSTTSTSLDGDLTPIMSNARNFVDELRSVNLPDVFNGAVIIAGDPMDLAAALTAQLGAQSALRRHREPRAIPLVYEDPRTEVNADTSSNGDSEFSTASTIGSDVSSEASELEESETRNQRTGQDDPIQFYDAALRQMIRKPLCPREDEPPIY